MMSGKAGYARLEAGINWPDLAQGVGHGRYLLAVSRETARSPEPGSWVLRTLGFMYFAKMTLVPCPLSLF